MVKLKLKTVAKVAVVSIAVAASSAFAAQQGPYVGGQLGWGKVYEAGVPGLKNSNSGLAGRVLGGYQITENISAELGWDKFSDVTAKNAFGKASLSRDAVDLVAKYSVPFGNNFGIYGKLGGAYVWEKVSVKTGGVTITGDKSEHKLLPTFGAGVTYDFTPNVVSDLSWTRIQKVGNKPDIATSDMVTLGFSYYFG